MNISPLFHGKPKYKEGVVERCQTLAAGGVFSPTISFMIKLVGDKTAYRLEVEFSIAKGSDMTAALTNKGDQVSFDYTELLSAQIKAKTFKNLTLEARKNNVK